MNCFPILHLVSTLHAPLLVFFVFRALGFPHVWYFVCLLTICSTFPRLSKRIPKQIIARTCALTRIHLFTLDSFLTTYFTLWRQRNIFWKLNCKTFVRIQHAASIRSSDFHSFISSHVSNYNLRLWWVMRDHCCCVESIPFERQSNISMFIPFANSRFCISYHRKATRKNSGFLCAHVVPHSYRERCL